LRERDRVPFLSMKIVGFAADAGSVWHDYARKSDLEAENATKRTFCTNLLTRQLPHIEV